MLLLRSFVNEKIYQKYFTEYLFHLKCNDEIFSRNFTKYSLNRDLKKLSEILNIKFILFVKISGNLKKICSTKKGTNGDVIKLLLRDNKFFLVMSSKNLQKRGYTFCVYCGNNLKDFKGRVLIMEN